MIDLIIEDFYYPFSSNLITLPGANPTIFELTATTPALY
jgi:hypothetical protein